MAAGTKADTTAATVAALEAFVAPLRDRAEGKADLADTAARLRAECSRLAGKYGALVEAHTERLGAIRESFFPWSWGGMMQSGTVEGRQELQHERAASSTLGCLRRWFASTPTELAEIETRLAMVEITDARAGATLTAARAQVAEITRRLGLVPGLVQQLEEAMAPLVEKYPNAKRRVPLGYRTDDRRPPAKPPRPDNALPIGPEFEGGMTR